MIKDGQIYKGFRCIETVDVPECNSTGVWLRHEESGMEVFHLLNNDEENLFAFCFRTPCSDNTGISHVLEHSVLCGSKKYPLQDPMKVVDNQSVNTFLNAMTAFDHTIYPASSIVKADYFNIMSIYADAVFFPLLREEVFLQECHRLEFDENGKPSIQGVVYNEMKGGASNFNSVAYRSMIAKSLEGTIYGYNSGGDPCEMTSLTHSRLKAFHRKHYNPSNCLVFLYGNIPTEEQLDFFDENIFSNSPVMGKPVKWERLPKDFAMEPFVKLYGPAGDSTDTSKAHVNLIWLVSRNGKDRARVNIENLFLAHLLWGSSSAPLRKLLMESGLGTDISPESGFNSEMYFTETCVGLMGVEPSDAKKVKKLILNGLKEICEKGIASQDIERTAMAFKFSNREIRRANGPYSLVYMNRVYRGWIYGEKPWSTLSFNEEFEILYKKIQEDPGCLSELIHKYLIDNEDCSLYTIMPSKSWGKKRAAVEKANVKEILCRKTREQIQAENEKLRRFQDNEPTEEDLAIVPRIHAKDLNVNVEKIPTVSTEIDGVRLFINKQPTNGILYFDVAFPCDVLPAKEYPYLPAFTTAATGMGWNDLSWDKATSLMQSKCGYFYSTVVTSRVPDESLHLVQEKDYVGRDWVMYCFSVLEENIQEAFELLSDCITGNKFSDTKHLQDLMVNEWNYSSSEVIPAAYYYSSCRASSLLNRSTAIGEILNGLSSVVTLKNISESNMDELAQHFRNILARLRKGGAILHMTGTSKGIAASKKIIPSFISKCALKPLAQRYNSRDEDFYKLTVLPGELKKVSKKSDILIDELVEVPGNIGFAGLCMESDGFGSKEATAGNLYCSHLSNLDLYKQIRLVGGAYSAYFSADPMNYCSTFITHRDPKPYESLFTFRDVVRKSAEKPFLPEDVERCIITSYSSLMTPLVPSSKGSIAFFWELYGFDRSFTLRKLKWLKSMKPKDFEDAARRYAENVDKHRVCIICGSELISDKMRENARKIVRLPL